MAAPLRALGKDFRSRSAPLRRAKSHRRGDRIAGSLGVRVPGHPLPDFQLAVVGQGIRDSDGAEGVAGSVLEERLELWPI